jgi:hypothetical protein
MESTTSMLTRLGGLLVAVALAGVVPDGRAAGLQLVGHLGGVSATESVSGLGDLDWKTGVADLALEASVFGPLSAGIGGEALLDTDHLAVSSKQAGFAYLKLRPPLPFSPYAGLGLELRRAEETLPDGSTDSGWHRGRVLLLGLGLRLARVSFDLEFRSTRTELDTRVLHLYSLRPGVTVWF